MALYKVEKYNKKTRFYKEELVNLPSSVSFWLNSQRQSAIDKIKVRYVSKPTRTGLNRRVVYAFIDFNDGECWEYRLLSKKRNST